MNTTYIFFQKSYAVTKLTSPYGNYSLTKLLQYLCQQPHIQVIVFRGEPTHETVQNIKFRPNTRQSVRTELQKIKHPPVFIYSELGRQFLLALFTKLRTKGTLTLRLGGVAFMAERFESIGGRLKHLPGYLIRKLMFSLSDRIICTNDGSPIERVRKIFNLGPKLLKLPNGLPSPPVRPATPINPRKIIIISRLNYWKYVDIGIDAFARLTQSHPDLELDIIGEGEDEEKLKTLARTLGIADKVHFLGYQNLPAKEFDEAAIVWPLVSYNTTLEAIVYQKPCVCIDYGCSKDLFGPYPFVKIVPVKPNHYPIIDSADTRNRVVSGLSNATIDILNNYDTLKSDLDRLDPTATFMPWEERIQAELEFCQQPLPKS